MSPSTRYHNNTFPLFFFNRFLLFTSNWAFQLRGVTKASFLLVLFFMIPFFPTGHTQYVCNRTGEQAKNTLVQGLFLFFFFSSLVGFWFSDAFIGV
jgi:hypothetical protein